MILACGTPQPDMESAVKVRNGASRLIAGQADSVLRPATAEEARLRPRYQCHLLKRTKRSVGEGTQGVFHQPPAGAEGDLLQSGFEGLVRG